MRQSRQASHPARLAAALVRVSLTRKAPGAARKG